MRTFSNVQSIALALINLSLSYCPLQYHSIAADYNISMTTVSKIKKGRPSREEMEQNREAMSEVEAPSVKKLAEFYPLMNKRMLDWVNQAQKRNIRITSAMLQERAKVVADSIGWTSFRASSGWCVKFLRRNNIKLRTLKRAAQLKSTCQQATKWEDRILNPKIGPDGLEVPSDTSDSEAEMDNESLDSDSEDEDALGKPRTVTLAKARKAWSLLQDWFIAYPPQQDRILQAVFIINKEMMNPALVAAPDNTTASMAGSMTSTMAAALNMSVPTSSGSVEGNAAKAAKNKRAPTSASLPVSSSGGLNTAQGSTFYPIPAPLR